MPPTSGPRLPPSAPTPTGSSTGDRRVQRSRDAVLSAALEILEESGVRGFSVDEVARRSGVAKTTIYRHWPRRETLVLDTCARLTESQKVPDTGSFACDLHSYLTATTKLLETANWSAVVPSIVDAAERDAEFAAVHSEIQRGHAAPVIEIIRRAISRGELDEDTDPATVAATLLGPLFYRRWFARAPLDEPFVDAVIRGAVASLYL